MGKTINFSTNTTSSNNPTAKVGDFSDMCKAHLKLTEIKESEMKDSYVYCRFELFMNEGKSTPRYRIAEMFGEYPPFDTAIRDRFGNLVVYLKEHSSKNPDAPELQLQAIKHSFNLTGLKFLSGWNVPKSRFAYGYPDSRTEIKKVKRRKLNDGTIKVVERIIPNPFYDYRADGYLILLGDCNIENVDLGKIPQSFELIVVRGGKQMIHQTCRLLANGGLNPDLDWLGNHASKKPILLI